MTNQQMTSATDEHGRSEIIAGTPTTKTLVAQFTKRDLMLYGLGIGCCDSDGFGGELRFVYEHHPYVSCEVSDGTRRLDVRCLLYLTCQ